MKERTCRYHTGGQHRILRIIGICISGVVFLFPVKKIGKFSIFLKTGSNYPVSQIGRVLFFQMQIPGDRTGKDNQQNEQIQDKPYIFQYHVVFLKKCTVLYWI
jgi:hypothetical protein